MGSFTVKLSACDGSEHLRQRADRDPGPDLDRLPGRARSGTPRYASLGITNALDLLQVSPTDTALELTAGHARGARRSRTRTTSRAPPTDETFARVVPTSAREAKAQVHEMQALGVTEAVRRRRRQSVRAAIADAVSHDARRRDHRSSAARPARTASSTAPPPTAVAARFFNGAAGPNPSAKLFGPSALDATRSFVSELSSAVRNLYVSSPGFLKPDLTPGGQRVRREVQLDVRPRAGRRRRSSATRRCRRCSPCSRRPAHRPTTARRSSTTSSRSRTASRCSAPTRSTATATRASRRSCSAAWRHGSLVPFAVCPGVRLATASERGDAWAIGSRSRRSSALVADRLRRPSDAQRHRFAAARSRSTRAPLHGASGRQRRVGHQRRPARARPDPRPHRRVPDRAQDAR